MDSYSKNRPTTKRQRGEKPEFTGEDRAKPAKGGGLEGFRTVKAEPSKELRKMQEAAQRGGIQLPGNLQGLKTVERSLSPTKITDKIDKRNNQHAHTFKKGTNQPSAKRHAEEAGLDIPARMEILHAQGYGQIGRKGDTELNNLAAGSHGANTQMIPYDNVMTGNKNVTVTSRHNVFKDTYVADTITQSFTHPNYQGGNFPFFEQHIAGDRSDVTRDEYKEHKERAKKLGEYVRLLDQGSVSHSFEEMEFQRAGGSGKSRFNDMLFSSNKKTQTSKTEPNDPFGQEDTRKKNTSASFDLFHK
jgi:hypothetical protein